MNKNSILLIAVTLGMLSTTIGKCYSYNRPLFITSSRVSELPQKQVDQSSENTSSADKSSDNDGKESSSDENNVHDDKVSSSADKEVISSSEKKTIVTSKNESVKSSQKKADNTLENESKLPDAGTWLQDFPDANNNNIFGIAGKFNLFSRAISVTQDRVFSGNFATQHFQSIEKHNAFGTGVSYVQSSIAGSTLKTNTSKLAIGKFIDYTKKVDPSLLNLKKVVQDRNQQYINFDSEFQRLNTSSQTISTFASKNSHLDIVSPNPWYKPFKELYVRNTTVINGTTMYLNVKGDDELNILLNFDIKDMPSNVKTVVINVDTSNVTNDITIANNNSNSKLKDKKLLFNFYNATQNTPYTGTINFSHVQSSELEGILAPEAIVNIATASWQGNIISKSINVNNAIDSASIFPDLPIPSGGDDGSDSVPRIIKVPDVSFGTQKLGQQNDTSGDWTGHFEVQGQKIKMFVSTWRLISLSYQIMVKKLIKLLGN